MRAEGGFGLTMTCAASVQDGGQGFSGQLGAHDDRHIPGLARLASALRAQETHAVLQLHHAGMRSPAALIGRQPLCPSANAETNARAITRQSLENLARLLQSGQSTPTPPTVRAQQSFMPYAVLAALAAFGLVMGLIIWQRRKK